MAFYNKDIQDIFTQLGSGYDGLNQDTVKENYAKYGSNEHEKAKKIGFFGKFLL